MIRQGIRFDNGIVPKIKKKSEAIVEAIKSLDKVKSVEYYEYKDAVKFILISDIPKEFLEVNETEIRTFIKELVKTKSKKKKDKE